MQPLRGGLGVGAAGRRAGAVFEIGDARDQRLAAEQPGEGADVAVELQVGDRIGHIAGVAERDHPAGQCMANLVDPGADRRFDVIAAFASGNRFQPLQVCIMRKTSARVRKSRP